MESPKKRLQKEKCFFGSMFFTKQSRKNKGSNDALRFVFFFSSLFSLFKADPPPALGWLLLKMFLLHSAINSYIIRLFFHFSDFSPPFFLKMSFSHFACLLYFFSGKKKYNQKKKHINILNTVFSA